MSKPAYWLCLFNPTTWQEFLDAGAETVGFPHTQLKTFTRIESGDYIIAAIPNSNLRTAYNKRGRICWNPCNIRA